MSKIYEYVKQKGLAGVPGLPHVISEDEAKKLGVEEILKAAVKNGSYIERKAEQPKPAAKPAAVKVKENPDGKH